MEDIFRIVGALVIGYVVFIGTFYYLAKWMFPAVEPDEEYNKLIENYKKSKSRIVSNTKINAYQFKVPASLRPRMTYTLK